MSARSEGELLDFLGHIEHLANQAGIELDDEDRVELYEKAEAAGFSPEATEMVFAAEYLPEDSELGSDDEYEDFEDDDSWEDEDLSLSSTSTRRRAGTLWSGTA